MIGRAARRFSWLMRVRRAAGARALIAPSSAPNGDPPRISDYKYYQPGETPWLPREKYFTQHHIAFAPPAEYGEENVSVPVDHSKDVRRPWAPAGPPR